MEGSIVEGLRQSWALDSALKFFIPTRYVAVVFLFVYVLWYYFASAINPSLPRRAVE